MTTRIAIALTIAAAFILILLTPAPTAASTAAAPLASDHARAVYEDYGCVACHGDSGNGSCDLRRANETFPTDAALRAFIDDPSATHPGSKMPAYRNVIEAADYPALIAHVRRLSRQAR
ncbi:MAG: c-type cytochrome [Polyangiaceae bacterium]